MTNDALSLAMQLLDAWNARDISRFTDLLSDDIEWYDPGMPKPPTHGKDAVRAFAESMLRAFPDFRYEIVEPVCVSSDGSRCAVPWRITATHTVRLDPPGFASTGRTMCQEGVDLIDVKNNKITRILTCFDSIAAAEQMLGVTIRPEPGTFRERVTVYLQRIAAFRARRLKRP